MERMLQLSSQLSGVDSNTLQEARDGPRRLASKSKFSEESRPEPSPWRKEGQQYMLRTDIGVLPAPGLITGRLKNVATLFAKARVHGFAPRQSFAPEGEMI